MKSLRSSVSPRAATPMNIGRRPARARGGTGALIGIIVLLTSSFQLYAQRLTATTSLVLQVRPEELLEDQNGSVALKIRLAPGATARLWTANSCSSPSPSSHVISMSGIYSIPTSALTRVISKPSPTTMRVCLASSDGVLTDSLPVEILDLGKGAAVQGVTPLIAPSGASVDLPAGWAVTTQAAITTTSRP